MKTIEISKIKELREKGIIPQSISCGGNVTYSIRIYGNFIYLYKLDTYSPCQKWNYIQVKFDKKYLN